MRIGWVTSYAHSLITDTGAETLREWDGPAALYPQKALGPSSTICSLLWRTGIDRGEHLVFCRDFAEIFGANQAGRRPGFAPLTQSAQPRPYRTGAPLVTFHL